MEILIDTTLLRVERHTAESVVVVRRTVVPAKSAAEIIGAYHAAVDELETDTHRGWGLIIDVRDAPGRNDPEFEQSLPEIHRRIAQTFSRTVILVSTAAGVLQNRRLAVQQGLSELAADNEKEAFRLARGQ